jgi:hypothetical protein
VRGVDAGVARRLAPRLRLVDEDDGVARLREEEELRAGSGRRRRHRGGAYDEEPVAAENGEVDPYGSLREE